MVPPALGRAAPAVVVVLVRMASLVAISTPSKVELVVIAPVIAPPVFCNGPVSPDPPVTPEGNTPVVISLASKPDPACTPRLALSLALVIVCVPYKNFNHLMSIIVYFMVYIL
jgi:hypothetical protein